MRQFGKICFSKRQPSAKGGAPMNDEKKAEVLKKIPLFSALSDREISELITKSEASVFAPGKEIVSSTEGRFVKVVLSGSVSVTKKNGDKELLMRVVQTGGILGVASLFTEKNKSLSTIKAIKEATVIFISGEAVQSLVSENKGFAESYIRLLTAKIQFLNNRVKAYTSVSAKSRLAFHILSLDEERSGRVDVGVSKTALADMLDVGRASLYRALDTLTEKGIIKYEKNEIIILDPEALTKAAEGR